mmetsp:Transcript_2262/g.2735  ORF Transcript_2262/g.2735 Transcript_2262/m.2735 type:complete len:265 (+) Transcript_2262:128-922(+)
MNPNLPDPPAGHDLQFVTSVDNTSTQNVPIPPVPTLNQNPNNTTGAGPQSYMNQLFESSSHPIICIFHVLFKALAIMTYLLGGIAQHSLNFITVTVCCILLLAVDFWVVKNITGRLLVGLRWWAQVDLDADDGMDETRWIFESKENMKINTFDQTWFWTTLYVTPGIWIVFFVFGLLRLNFGWLITVSFGVALNCANVYGYWKCSKDQKAKFQQMVQRGAEMGAASAIRHNLFGRMSSFASSLGGVSPTTNTAGSSNAHSIPVV